MVTRVRVVYASSAAVYGIPQHVPMDQGHPISPLSPYGVSKLGGEILLGLPPRTRLMSPRLGSSIPMALGSHAT